MSPDPQPPAQDLFVETPDGRIRIRIIGDGPVVVLCLHGVSAQGRSWLPVARRLGDRATFVLPDLLGRGASDPRPDLRYTLEHEADRVRDLVSALCLADVLDPAAAFPVILAGHSHGAAIALRLAGEETSVRGLLLSNPVTPWTRRPPSLGLLGVGLIRRLAAGIFSPLRRPLAHLILRRAAGPAYRATHDMVAAYAAPFADRRRAETLMRILADWQPAELDGRLPADRPIARVVIGELDPRITVACAERLAIELGGPLLRIADGGHVLPEQHPDLLAGELEKVLQAVSAEASRP